MMDRLYAPWRSKYFTMERSGGCLFCEIQKEIDEGKALFLKRGRHWFVILNLFPYTNGHIMIVANRHIERLSDITPEEGGELVGLPEGRRHARERRHVVPAHPDRVDHGRGRQRGPRAGGTVRAGRRTGPGQHAAQSKRTGHG